MNAFTILIIVSIFTVTLCGIYTAMKIIGVVRACLFVKKHKDRFDLDFDKVSVSIDTPPVK